MVKTLQKSSSLKNRANCFETWDVALVTWAHHNLFKWWPWIDLHLFYAKIKFGHLCFCMGKSKRVIHWASWSQIAYGASVGLGGTEVSLNDPGHMTKMAAMPIYSKILSSSLVPVGQLPWNLVCSIGASGHSFHIFVQMMTLGWPWPILCQG